MARFDHFRTLASISLAAGANFTEADARWTADRSYIIKRIYFLEKTGEPLYQLEVTGRVEEFVFTKEYVSARVFGVDIQTAPELNISLPDRKTISFAGTNRSTITYNFYIILELWIPE